jgi:hypothetical protein
MPRGRDLLFAYEVYASKVRANPSIERTLSGLRPPRSAHVKR